MSGTILDAHSLAEIYLYLMVTPCPNCGRGPLQAGTPQPGTAPTETRLRIKTVCKSCKHEFNLGFNLAADQFAAARDAAPDQIVEVNPTGDPSEIVDLAGWLTLFRTITEAAAKTQDKAESRMLGYEAALCLEEALKLIKAAPASWASFSFSPLAKTRTRTSRPTPLGSTIAPRTI